jgi:hypothetical protein
MIDDKGPPPQLQLVRETIATVEEAHPPGRVWPFIVAALIVAASSAMVIWKQLQADPIMRLPPAERYAMYVKTLEHFTRICEVEELGRDVQALCANEADLLRRFPDCDQTCRDLTSSYAHAHPSR